MNVVLIGMAGSGKSFIGRKLAARLDYGFVDTDDLIRQKTGETPFQQIVDERGDAYFLKVEREAIMGQTFPNRTVISPGGSVVYMDDVMEHLRKDAIVCFLDTPLQTIKARNPEMMKRGIIGLKGGKTLEDVYRERHALYKKYSDMTFHDEADPDKLAERIASAVKGLAMNQRLNPPDIQPQNQMIRRTN